MPIIDQGYQHWNGALQGHAWRWVVIARQGIRNQLRNRWVWGLIFVSCIPALVLSSFLVIWGLFEQKSALLTPWLFLFKELPEELRTGPRGFRTSFWTLAFDFFLAGQVFSSMFLVLLIGPDLISQDLRFNALPLYFSRPVRRLDYFAGKLGVIAVYLSAVTIVPVLLAYGLGVAFSMDPLVFRDTWRIFLGALFFCLVIVVSAGTLVLAISSLSRNSRYVAAMWLGVWILSETAAGVLYTTIHKEWCPLISYTANLSRVRTALLDADAAWSKVRSLSQAGQDSLPRGTRNGFIRPGRGGRFGGPAPRGNGPGAGGDRLETTPHAPYPWQWSAGVLAGLGVLSLWILATRVRSLDRLR